MTLTQNDSVKMELDIEMIKVQNDTANPYKMRVEKMQNDIIYISKIRENERRRNSVMLQSSRKGAK